MRIRFQAAARTHWLEALVVAGSLSVVSGCSEKVSLGAWLETVVPAPVTTQTAIPVLPPPTSGAPDASAPVLVGPPSMPMDAGRPAPSEVTPTPTPVDASVDRLDASVDGGTDAAPAMVLDAGFPGCGEEGEPGAFNRAGNTIGVTIPYTDWSWPRALDSVEFDLLIEQAPEVDGYFWAYQFGFVSGIVGLFGLQANGGYQSDPPTGDTVWTNMLILWISGPPLGVELGDTPYPDARTADEYSRGIAWKSIHMLYPWEVCRVYRFRLALESTQTDGNRWYGGWVTDTTTNETKYVGRMLVPMEWGQLSTSSSMWTDRFNVRSPTPNCAAVEPGSAVWGAPRGDDGAVLPLSFNNRFDVAKCGGSRFTVFPDAIRQELAIKLMQ